MDLPPHKFKLPENHLRLESISLSVPVGVELFLFLGLLVAIFLVNSS